jgi:hypothetical protein
MVIKNKLPLINSIWKSIKYNLLQQNHLSYRQWESLILENIKSDRDIPQEILTKFIDEIVDIQKKGITPVTVDVLFEGLTKKYKQKKLPKKSNHGGDNKAI